jgi:hypothetical protein
LESPPALSQNGKREGEYFLVFHGGYRFPEQRSGHYGTFRKNIPHNLKIFY